MQGSRFHPAGQLPAGEQYPSAAAQAFDTDICSQPDNFPLVSSAGMRLAQTKDVIQL